MHKGCRSQGFHNLLSTSALYQGDHSETKVKCLFTPCMKMVTSIWSSAAKSCIPHLVGWVTEITYN